MWQHVPWSFPERVFVVGGVVVGTGHWNPGHLGVDRLFPPCVTGVPCRCRLVGLEIMLPLLILVCGVQTLLSMVLVLFQSIV